LQPFELLKVDYLVFRQSLDNVSQSGFEEVYISHGQPEKISTKSSEKVQILALNMRIFGSRAHLGWPWLAFINVERSSFG
jgi:hypothetical protein